ncbi:MAG: helix-turn-helix domain-containing protein, partial [Planctomycetota bacterium]|nr:helix-turn-helix domain-containing protein [Planctomycetota bacterium]
EEKRQRVVQRLVAHNVEIMVKSKSPYTSIRGGGEVRKSAENLNACRAEAGVAVKEDAAGVVQKQPKRPGRPRVQYDPEKLFELRKAGRSVRQIADALGIGKSTVCNALRASTRADASGKSSGQAHGSSAPQTTDSPAACDLTTDSRPKESACSKPGDRSEPSSGERTPPRDGATDVLMTVPEVARYMGVREQTVRKWVCQRRIPYVKIGRSVRFRREDIEEFLRKHRRGGFND